MEKLGQAEDREMGKGMVVMDREIERMGLEGRGVEAGRSRGVQSTNP